MDNTTREEPTDRHGDTKDRFLRALGETANVTKSAKAAGCSRAVVYKWRDEDPYFAQMWQDVMEERLDGLEALVYKSDDPRIALQVLALKRPGWSKNQVGVQVNVNSENVESVEIKPSEDQWAQIQAWRDDIDRPATAD